MKIGMLFLFVLFVGCAKKEEGPTKGPNPADQLFQVTQTAAKAICACDSQACVDEANAEYEAQVEELPTVNMSPLVKAKIDPLKAQMVACARNIVDMP